MGSCRVRGQIVEQSESFIMLIGLYLGTLISSQGAETWASEAWGLEKKNRMTIEPYFGDGPRRIYIYNS